MTTEPQPSSYVEQGAVPKRWHVAFEWQNQWPALLHPRRFNWTDFTLIEVHGEASWYIQKHYYEAEFWLLGLGVVITVWRDRDERDPKTLFDETRAMRDQYFEEYPSHDPS